MVLQGAGQEKAGSATLTRLVFWIATSLWPVMLNVY